MLYKNDNHQFAVLPLQLLLQVITQQTKTQKPWQILFYTVNSKRLYSLFVNIYFVNATLNTLQIEKINIYISCTFLRRRRNCKADLHYTNRLQCLLPLLLLTIFKNLLTFKRIVFILFPYYDFLLTSLHNTLSSYYPCCYHGGY